MTMRPARMAIAVGALCASGLAASAESNAIAKPDDAVRAAQRYTKARCATEGSCTFRPEREGKQWRVWVKMTKREGGRSVSAGGLVLYFDAQGNLLRRLETD